jgi:CO/xanthine dehydrogenase Mo-binding subunit
MTSQAAFIGTPVERIEDLRLLTGRGRYVDDLHWEGMGTAQG